MLSRLLRGLEETNQVLLSVGRCVSVQDILVELLQNLSNDNVLITTSPTPSCVQGCAQVYVVDVGDVLGWDNKNIIDNKNIQKFLDNILEQVKDRKVVVIDSLTTFYLLFSPTEVAHFLCKLKRGGGKVICVLHSDCVKEGVISELEHLVTTSVSVEKLEENQTNVYPKLCHIRHKKPGGKLVNSRETYFVDSEGKIKIEVFKEVEKKQTVEDDEDEAIDKLTTFNLGTNQKEQEKKAKENLVLPFYKPEQQVDGGSEDRGEVKIGGGNDGKIYYEPDSGDDWDEEDPDDDLDF